MRRLMLVVVVLSAVGCAGPRQRAAEDAVAARVGYGANVSCTRSARVGYFRELRTKQFLCLVERKGSTCDRYVATVVRQHFVVRLAQRDADCILPPS